MIAYHFPPVSGSSGVQRALRFANYLLDHDWHPIVLTVNTRAYESTSGTERSEVRDEVKVYRCCALDTARHLSIRGKYPSALARPDRWSSWKLPGIVTGLRLIRRYRPELIWSTFPIATANAIAATLARFSRLPWVADFRDMMIDVDYPADPDLRRYLGRLEEKIVSRASKVVFTTPGTVALYQRRYPHLPADRWTCIRNGFDHESMQSARARVQKQQHHSAVGRRSVTLLHSGILYPSERDPRHFLQAIAQLKASGDLTPYGLKVVLRATGHDLVHQQEISRLNIGDIVSLAPTLDYGAALEEMLNADGLLVFQASNCNNQIPAKLYEYFAAGKPILGLTDLDGETAQTMREAGIHDLADLTDTEAIKAALLKFLDSVTRGVSSTVREQEAVKYSRSSQTAELAQLFDELN